MAALVSPSATAAEDVDHAPPEFVLQDGQTVLFQGDSITDAGRKKDQSDSLGGGYPSLIAPWILAAHPEEDIRFLNRGVSGNRVVELQERWEEDCIDLKPDWLSILIGVNDTWRGYDSNDPTSADQYEVGYKKLLDRVHEHLQTQIILLEPFILNVGENVWKMREDLDSKRAAARRISEEYNTLFVPLDDHFQAASEHREPEFWAKDGVHPTPAGHALIAQAWLEAVGA